MTSSSYPQPQIPGQARRGPSSIGPVTVPDFALVATLATAAPGAPSGVALPGMMCDDTLIGLLTYVMLMPPPDRGPAGELLGLSGEQLRRLKSTMSYLVSRADALVMTGRGHLVDAAESAWLRGDEVPPRSYVGVTVATAERYLTPAIADAAAVNRPRRNGNGNGSGPRTVIIPEPGGSP